MCTSEKENDFNKEVVNSARKLKIRIQNQGTDGMNISLPLQFVKQMAKMGNGISGIVGGGSLDSVELDEILVLAENGVTGEILNIVTDDGGTISISVE
ncbi:MAG: hypothetical protein IJ025_09430 [Clostridia bacterium]|nr:hypothetical protein [Clostridia bacterium]